MDMLRNLAAYLDKPFFPWKRLIIGFSVGQYLLNSYLSYRQYGVLCRTVIPAPLRSEVTQATYDKSQAYGRAKAKFGFVSGLFSQAQHLALLGYDVYVKLWHLTGSWLPYVSSSLSRLTLGYVSEKAFAGEITHTIVFVLVFELVQSLLDLPFSYYHHFILEEAFGFNKQTVRLWITDFLKSQALVVALGVPIGAAFLSIIQKTGQNFFYYVWLFMLGVQVFAITIFPIWIVPLFNKLSPLPAGTLKDAVEALAAKLKFPLGELQVIDGSTRSAHSNAYFTGLPWKKKIVLYDTLIEKSEEEEVVAVLAHELGHWKMGHTTKQLGIAQVQLFFTFALFSCFINNNSLYEAFGFHKEHPIIIGFLLFNEVLTPADAVVSLLTNILSRKFEFEADAFGARMGYSAQLASSLIKLQIQNLSAMDADWMYSAYNYSHPILTERLSELGWTCDEKITPVDGNLSGAGSVAKASGREL